MIAAQCRVSLNDTITTKRRTDMDETISLIKENTRKIVQSGIDSEKKMMKLYSDRQLLEHIYEELLHIKLKLYS